MDNYVSVSLWVFLSKGTWMGAEPPIASEASMLASEASQPPAGTRLKTGHRPVEKASKNKVLFI